ncbi:MAG: hypothetical protein LPL29_12555 [Alphaproteobacteria bacterium]|nr:hypothetical protein [Alphaproteobacteria bacterium]MDX5416445.1 hypothetical protein [Alphaproteobacteria bacterium]
MPRNGSGVYSLPAGSNRTNGDTSDASDINSPLGDLETDANTVRPIVAGGTGASSAAAARTALSVQELNANLTSLAGLTFAANKGLYTTGANTAALFDLTAAGLALLDDADAAAQRTTLGLGSAAVLTAGTSANNAVQLDGSARLPAVDGTQLTGTGIGVGQTWQDVTGSRSAGTSYQNTTGKPIMVAIQANSAAAGKSLEVSSDNSTWIAVGWISIGAAPQSAQAIVPNNHYYRATSATSIGTWAELR